MGMTSAFFLVPDEHRPEDLGEWVPCAGTVPGWNAFARDAADPASPGSPWLGVDGPMLATFVMDSDFADLVFWQGGQPLAGWTINPEGRTAYEQENTGDPDPVRTMAGLARWCAAAGLSNPDTARLEDLLTRGWVLADEGLFSVFYALGVVPENGALKPERALRDLAAIEHHLLHPEPAALMLSDGTDATSMPHRPQRMFLAAPIEYGGWKWDWFVRNNELEAWGKPPCIVADSHGEVPASGLASWSPWNLYLATDPPVSLFGWFGALGDVPGIPEIGPWTVLPAGDDRDAAICWARENVGTCVEPPQADRDKLVPELVSPVLSIGDGYGSLAGDVVFSWELSTYEDLLSRAEAVAAWLTEARTALVTPFADSFGDRLVTGVEPETDGPTAGPAYGARLRLHTTTLRERVSVLSGDDDGWAKALQRLNDGELRRISIELERLNGNGEHSRLRRGLHIKVELRDQFSGERGPLADKHPAKVVMHVAKPLMDGFPDAWLHTVLLLMRNAAVSFGAVHGYATADGNTAGNSIQSTFERRHSLVWDGRRLDAWARGAHWGNLIGPKHLEAIGGIDTLHQLGLPLVTMWSDELCWFRLTDDPFAADRDRADEIARRLLAIMPTSAKPG